MDRQIDVYRRLSVWKSHNFHLFQDGETGGEGESEREEVMYIYIYVCVCVCLVHIYVYRYTCIRWQIRISCGCQNAATRDDVSPCTRYAGHAKNHMVLLFWSPGNFRNIQLMFALSRTRPEALTGGRWHLQQANQWIGKCWLCSAGFFLGLLSCCRF